MKIYSIYDSKAEAYLQPFFSPNNAVAIRNFQNVLQDPNSNINRWPEDFTLFAIGTWDEDTGQITPAEQIKSLGNGLQHREKQLELAPTKESNR